MRWGALLVAVAACYGPDLDSGGGPASRCGDGVVQPSVEECDSTAGCTSRCLACGEPEQIEGARGHCYRRLRDPALTWDQAAQACLAGGGHLATYETSEERSVGFTVATGTHHWIGLSDADTEGLWAWVTGPPLDYEEGWSVAEPAGLPEADFEDCAIQWDAGFADIECEDLVGIVEGAVCEDHGWIDRQDGHRYRWFLEPATWDGAQSACESFGGHLATLTSEVEQGFALAEVGRPTWIGARDQEVEGGFQWVTGEPIAYTDWGQGEPSDEIGLGVCLQIGVTQQWDDVPCDATAAFLCEVELE